MKRKLIKNVVLGVICSGFIGLAHAQNLDNLGVSQSYFITDTGRPFSVKSEVPDAKSGWSTLFSPSGFFYQPEIVETFGSKYIIIKNSRQVHTIDSQGEFYKSITQYADSKVKNQGSNYFITSKGTLYIVTTTGDLKEYKDEFDFKRARFASGMFLKLRNKQVYVTNPFTGRLDHHGEIDFGEVAYQGDNFLINKDGDLYTIGFGYSNGEYVSQIFKTVVPENITDITVVGGNFFFDQDLKVHTINDAGALDVSEDSNISISDHQGLKPIHIGSNYFMYENGNFFLVDEEGAVNFIENRPNDIKITNR